MHNDGMITQLPLRVSADFSDRLAFSPLIECDFPGITVFVLSSFCLDLRRIDFVSRRAGRSFPAKRRNPIVDQSSLIRQSGRFFAHDDAIKLIFDLLHSNLYSESYSITSL
jgi:hypothetical protein